MNNVMVGTDEPFVNSIGEIMYPGDYSADPANVWNCRCTLAYEVVGFKGINGKVVMLDEEEKPPENKENTLTKGGESGIIKSTKLSSDNTVVNPMNKDRYYKMKKNLEKQGCPVISAARGSDDEKFLLNFGAEAIADEKGIIHLGEIPSASAFFEETIHYAQIKKYGIIDSTDFTERAAREIAANRKLLRNGKSYGFTKEDFEDIERNLQIWENDFLERVGVSYDESKINREI